MKKIFTLIATALVAVGAHAQGSYGVQNGDAGVAAGSTETSVENITMTWGVEGGAAFKGGKKKNAALQDLLGATGYCEGNGENGSLTGGTVYYFAPTKKGAVTVGFVLNANKAFFVQETNGTNALKFSVTTADGTAVEIGQGGKSEEKLTGGVVTFPVEEGKTYAVFCTGSKLGYYGFKYEVGEEIFTAAVKGLEAKAVEKNGQTYNLAGQKVGKNFKGLVIENGKKVIK